MSGKKGRSGRHKSVVMLREGDILHRANGKSVAVTYIGGTATDWEFEIAGEGGFRLYFSSKPPGPARKP
jgi:hypothetical protein